MPGIGRFASADTIVPDPTNPQQYNRYGYTLNNPLRFTDPSGHCIVQYSGDVRMNEGPYGTSGLCPYTDHWETEASHAREEMYYSDGDGIRPSPPDAIGVIGSIEGGGGLSGKAAVELVINLHTGDITLFVIIGGGYMFGGDVSGNTVVELIYNIDEDNLNYRGIFDYFEAGGASGLGGALGHAWTPGDFTTHDEPYSIFAGVKFGGGAYGEVGRVEYIPIATTNLGKDEPEFHADDYLYGDLAPVNDVTEFMSPTGPLRYLYEALETAVSEYNQ